MANPKIKHPGKVIWEGVTWFIVAFATVLAIGFFSGILCLLFDSRWPGYIGIASAVGVLIGFPTRAIVREVRRQKNEVPIPGLGATEFEDSILGRLVRSEDDPDMWETYFQSDLDSIEVRIFGKGFPHESLLASARQLRENLSGLSQRLSAFKAATLAAEPTLRPFTDDINSLAVDTICFFHPEEPSEADVFYSGGLEGRCWHGALIDGTLTGLSFDR